jgi:thioredoxin reductase/ferredoxin
MTTDPDVLQDGSLVLDQPVVLPEVLDILIVGGGPAGTAAAFRAKELGRAALLVEHDDILKRIRDYDKRKPIKPDFGAGKQLEFPSGGPLVSGLRFDEIDKDEMHAKWRRLYRTCSVPARIGVELTGLHRDGSLWAVKVRNHNDGGDQVIKARHVVLALGGGMPRSLDIPGDVLSVSTKFGGAERFVGAPACVIGGGSSAAEAVIAISKAKAAASDSESVYWVYRGETMPKVAEALAVELFHAVNLNGNVRYLPNSDPQAVIKGADGRHHLRIQVDRKSLPHRPVETVHYEFPASHCLACIGQELPTRLLGALGIDQAVGGPNNRTAFVVTPLLESKLPDVHLVGDMLNQVYLECLSFAQDPSSFAERSHRGNIKRALTDGVLVADAIAQQLAGHEVVRVIVDVSPREAHAQAQPPEQGAAQGPAASPSRLVLTRILEGGAEAEQFAIEPGATTTIGSAGDCQVCFKDDSAMAPRHLSLTEKAGACVVAGVAQTGAFLKLGEDHPRTIPPGAMIKVGGQWLVFSGADGQVGFTHYDASGTLVGRHHLAEGTTLVGRDTPGIVLSPSDMTLSRRHASLAVHGRTLVVRDLHSVNGTYLRLVDGMPLGSGDELRVGQQVLRLSEVSPRPAKRVIEVDTTRQRRHGTGPAMPGAPRPAVHDAGLPAGLAIAFQELGKTCPFAPGQSVCEVAEANGIKIAAECHRGICGSDPIRVTAGHDHVNSMTEDERSTLAEICGVDPGSHRLACLTRPTGPIVVALSPKEK